MVWYRWYGMVWYGMVLGQGKEFSITEINVLKMARLRAKLNNMGSEWRHFEHVDFFKPVH